MHGLPTGFDSSISILDRTTQGVSFEYHGVFMFPGNAKGG